MIGVLFVCTGNICRSPTADGILRAKVAAAGLADRIVVDSAGTHAYHVGEAPDRRSIATAARFGIDLSPLRARQVSADDFRRHSLIVALDRGHRDHLERLAPPGSTDTIRLLTSFVPGIMSDVPDPYGENAAAFDRVYRLIALCIDPLFEHLKERLGATPMPSGTPPRARDS